MSEVSGPWGWVFIAGLLALAWIGMCRLLRVPRLVRQVGLCCIAALPLVAALGLLKEERLDRPLQEAAQDGNLARARSLLSWGADPDWRLQGRGVSSLELATELGHVEMVRLLFAHGGEVNRRGNDYWGFHPPALYSAAADGRGDLVRLLLSYGADPDTCAWPGGITSLHAAEAEGHREVVALLKHAGARGPEDER